LADPVGYSSRGQWRFPPGLPERIQEALAMRTRTDRFTALRIFPLLAAALLALPGAAQERREIPAARTYGEPANSAERSAIEALIEQYKDAWSRQDTQAWIALHAADTEWINAYARMFQGAMPLAGFIEHRLFPAFDSSASRQEIANMRTISVRYMGDDAAVVHMYTDGPRGPSRNAGESLRRTHLHLVLSKSSSVWKIVHTAIMDAR
jgi:uncharacterized protein (TIGR02246 family)